MLAICNRQFRFPDIEGALQRLAGMRKKYAGILPQPDDSNPGLLLIWIKGLAVTPEQQQQGFLGNVALVRVEHLPDEAAYTLVLDIVDVPLVEHPQRIKPKPKHPNWGHPLLRLIKNETVWSDREQARDILRTLHREFPDISIPAEADRLYIMVYNKQAEHLQKHKVPIQRLHLRVEETDDQQWTIRFNERKKAKKPVGTTKKNAQEVAAMAAMLGMGR